MRTKIEGGFRHTEAEAFFGGESDLKGFRHYTRNKGTAGH
jgi:hypothetical protein